jgi:hypothetical protein
VESVRLGALWRTKGREEKGGETEWAERRKKIVKLTFHLAALRIADQLVEIIKVLGTPTREQIKTMNPNVSSSSFPYPPSFFSSINFPHLPI